MKKRFLTLLIVFALLCALPFQAIALTDSEGQDESIDSILLKEIDVDPAVKNAIVDSFLDEANFDLQENDTVVLSKNYIQVSRPQNDGSIQSFFITGVNETGPEDFENIAREITRASYVSGTFSMSNYTITQYSEITITFTCYFYRGVNWEGYRFYRPYQLSASWAPVSGKSVTDLSGTIQYDSHGELIESPACMDDSNTYNDLVALVLDDYYTHTILVIIPTSLGANTTTSQMTVLPAGTAIWFSNYLLTGSSIGYEFDYTCNGKSRHISYYSFSLGSYY